MERQDAIAPSSSEKQLSVGRFMKVYRLEYRLHVCRFMKCVVMPVDSF